MLANIDALDSLGLRKCGGVYERFETTLVHGMVGTGMTFVDCGAHIGYYSSMAADLVGPTGAVFAFEPDPTNFALLALNMAPFNGAVRTYNVALSDEVGRSRLYFSPDNTGDHCLFDWDGRDSVEVDTVTLDSIEELSCRTVDFIKIDVQGYETRVLRGARQLLARSPNVIGIIEYAPNHIRRAGSSATEFCKELHSQGFNLFARSSNGLARLQDYHLEQLPAHINCFIARTDTP